MTVPESHFPPRVVDITQNNSENNLPCLKRCFLAAFLLKCEKSAYVWRNATSLSRDIGAAFPGSLTQMRSRPLDGQAERRVFKLFILVVNCVRLEMNVKVIMLLVCPLKT